MWSSIHKLPSAKAALGKLIPIYSNRPAFRPSEFSYCELRFLSILSHCGGNQQLATSNMSFIPLERIFVRNLVTSRCADQLLAARNQQQKFQPTLQTPQPACLQISKMYPGVRNFCVTKTKAKRALVTVTYIKNTSEKFTVQGKEGDNLLDVVVDNNVDLDGYGACEGTLACSTCHLVFSKEMFDKIPEQATDEELDMLDLAYGLTDLSRLGCQVCLTKEMEGMEVHVPAGVNDAREPEK